MTAPNLPIRERLLLRTEPDLNSGCWLWSGSGRASGHGQLCIAGKMMSAHRLSYEEAFGPIPKGLHVLHKCDVGACINPDHLFLGTHQDNMDDKVRKGRAKGQVGEKHPHAVLTESAVREILKLIAKGLRQTDIAAQYGVSAEAVSAIKFNRSWRHVPREQGETQVTSPDDLERLAMDCVAAEKLFWEEMNRDSGSLRVSENKRDRAIEAYEAAANPATILALLSANREMREALRPFSALADMVGESWTDETPAFVGAEGVTITIGQLRKARSALTTQRGDGE